MNTIISLTTAIAVFMAMLVTPVAAMEQREEPSEEFGEEIVTVQELDEEELALDIPVIKDAKLVSVCKVSLKWTEVDGAEGYEVWRINKEGWKYRATVTEPKAIVRGVHKRTPRYKVRAFATGENGLVYSEWSPSVPVRTKAIVGEAKSADKKKKLGDQTGKEVKKSLWRYTASKKKRRHYTMVLRMKDPEKAEIVAHTVEKACTSDYVGFSMNKKKRVTFYKELKKVGWDIDKLHKPCATSCTRLACAAINAAGVKFPYDIDSYDLRKAAKRHKKSILIIYDKSYLTTYKKLKRGDILCDEPHHTVIVL